MTLVQRDLRGLYRGTTAMHGGMLMAALGAASLGNFAAALLVAVAMGLALGGLGMMITSLEERVGAVGFRGPGGRAGGVPDSSPLPSRCSVAPASACRGPPGSSPTTCCCTRCGWKARRARSR